MLTIEVKAEGAAASLKAIGERAANLAPAMKRVGARLLADIHRNFREGGRYPQAWKPIRRAGQILVKSGLLRRSMQQRSGEDFAEAGSSLRYARIHQQGGTVRIPARWQPRRAISKGSAVSVFARRSSFGRRKTGSVSGSFLPAHDIHIPARPFLPIDAAGSLSPQTAVWVEKQIGEYVVSGKGDSA